jgi:putative tricarboxylic transport membrane protein
MLISRGDALVFVKHPISAFFLFLCVVLILAQIYVRLRKPKASVTEDPSAVAFGPQELMPGSGE